jgi:hypothetical protein
MKELRLGTKLAIDEDVKFDKMINSICPAAERYAPSPACASADPVHWRADPRPNLRFPTPPSRALDLRKRLRLQLPNALA